MNVPAQRRVLFLSYYFPPSGGSAVQRSLKWSRFLPEFGWQPTVLTVRPEDASYPYLDESLLKEVPDDLRVERTRSWDPYALYGRMTGTAKGESVGVGFAAEGHENWKQQLAKWVRANLFLPDARIGWIPFAYRKACGILDETPHDVLLTTGPPHSTHLSGLLIARKYGIPWIADFRDPWTEIDFAHELPTTAPARAWNEALERAVLRRASVVTVVSPSWARGLERRVTGRYEVIWNGFDPSDFDVSVTDLPDYFYLTYVGSLNAARNPHVLWRALAAAQVHTRMPKLRVRLIGTIDPRALESARECGIGDIVEPHAYMPYSDAMRELRRSALLLLLINDVPNQMGVVPAKIFEYLASGRPTLGIGPPDGDSAFVLQSTEGGAMYGYDDVEGVRAFVKEHYEAWAAGTPRSGASPEAAMRFSRKRQTGQMAVLLDELAGPPQ